MPGLRVLPLAGYGSEHTALVDWAQAPASAPTATLAAKKSWCSKACSRMSTATTLCGTWLHPDGSAHQPYSETGCLIWVKTGHLPSKMTLLGCALCGT